MRVMLAAGGTGGHFYPALALSKGLLKNANVNLLFVGERKGPEAETARKNGIPFRGIFVTKLRRGHIFTYPKFFFAAIIACIQSLFFVLQFRPDVAVGMGGYVSGPVILVSALCGIPTFIHEQNTVAGLTNRILGRFIRKAGISFEASRAYFPVEKVEFTGNPVREEIFLARKESSLSNLHLSKDKKVVLIFGGSRGARKINIALANALKFLNGSSIQILHITGREDYGYIESLTSDYRLSTITYHLYPYLENMWDALVSADLVVSRAGATSIAEITARGLPAILIPYPYAADNHQLLNAGVLREAGAAMILLNEELTGENLAMGILELIENPDVLAEMGRKSKSLSHPDAIRKTINIIYRLAGEGKTA